MIKDGEIVNIFNSIEAYEFSKSKIYQSIKHKTKYKGYYFEFL